MRVRCLLVCSDCADGQSSKVTTSQGTKTLARKVKHQQTDIEGLPLMSWRRRLCDCSEDRCLLTALDQHFFQLVWSRVVRRPMTVNDQQGLRRAGNWDRL